MKILITADVHNGVPGRLDDTVWAMDIMRDYADKHGIEHVFVLGDLFHDRVNLNIEVLNRTYDVLERARNGGQEWMCFPGNHDMFYKNSWEHNSLHHLRTVMTVHEEPSRFELGGRAFHVLPFIYYESEYMEALSRIDAGEEDVLLTHIGVNSAQYSSCFLLQNWNMVNFSSSPFRRIYTGHFHCHQQVGPKTWYPGSPIPFKFDEGMVDHGFLVFDVETCEHEFVNINDAGAHTGYRPPDYLTVTDEDVEATVPMAKGNRIRIVLSREYTNEELGRMHDVLKEAGAEKVDWTTPRIKEDDEGPELDVVLDGSGEPQDVFSAWVSHDCPEDLDIEFLAHLHGEVSQKAVELYVSTEEDE